ncbi:MAG: HAD-IG family 5'-nucleotidase [Deltaproteobacteria bacterium]|nr:HAD-IG family 5'-nucleotidase [Deltaproteobacteria bacterium]
MNQHNGAAAFDVPPPPRRIFVNRNLRMDVIKAVGFDMDYTLARYRREHLEKLAHRLTVEKLIERGYPEEIRTVRYDPEYVIRGLTVDKELGNILKLDRHDHVGRVMHGRQHLDKRQRRQLYRKERLTFTPPRFAMVDTLFSLPEVCLYADLVALLEKRPGGKIDTWQLFDDTRECIDEAHRDDSLKSIVRAALPDYIERDPLLGRTLHKLRSGGKKLFLLTNSAWDYTHTVMSHLLDGELSEYPTWKRYFELIVVAARKPSFFTGAEPFAALDEQGAIVQRPAARLEKGVVYQGGHRVGVERAFGFSGEEILYVGDHIYGDILRSKKASLWRTALIVEELEGEIELTLRHRADIDALVALEHQRRQLDERANLQRQQLAAMERELGDDARAATQFIALRRQRDQTKRQLKQALVDLDALGHRLDRAFNPHWGMMFKEAQENSRFGEQVTEYACVYTSRVSNFLGYSTHQYFRSPGDVMPHERS